MKKYNRRLAKGFSLFLILMVFSACVTQEKNTDAGSAPSFERPAWVDDEVYPFESRSYRWKGHRLHYIDEHPQGTPKGTVLAIHGNGTWSLIYRKMVTQLKNEGFRVIAMDHFGFGLSDFPHLRDFDYRPRSQAAVIRDFVREKGLTDLYLVLQDWGGPIGLAVAQSLPERVSGILLMNTWAWTLPAYPEGEFNPYHAVHDRGIDAITNPAFYLNGGLVRGGARGLARRNAEEGSPLYNALERMQMAPYIDPDHPEILRYEGVTLPVWISARSTVEEHDFLDGVEKHMPLIRHLPVYFMFGDDTAFGPLKVDLGMHEPRPLCPEGLKAESGEVTWKTNCVDQEGNLVWPYLDRFLSLWEDRAVVGIWQDPSYGHWLQDEVPEAATAAVAALWKRGQP